MKRESFALKLSLALGLTVLLAVATIAVLLNVLISRHFEEYVSVGTQPRLYVLVPVLESYYAANGHWDGAADLLQPTPTPTKGGGAGGGGGGGGGGAHRGEDSGEVNMEAALIIADASGRVVADATDRYVGTKLNKTVLERAQTLTFEGRIVGYLGNLAGPREVDFRNKLNISILWAGILVSVVAILLGIVATSRALKPLHIVREGAKRIGAGDLSYRVPVQSQDELGDLAAQFNEMAARPPTRRALASHHDRRYRPRVTHATLGDTCSARGAARRHL